MKATQAHEVNTNTQTQMPTQTQTSTQTQKPTHDMCSTGQTKQQKPHWFVNTAHFAAEYIRVENQDVAADRIRTESSITLIIVIVIIFVIIIAMIIILIIIITVDRCRHEII